jgi:hypothetical protein
MSKYKSLNVKPDGITGKIYISGPMSGIENSNFDAFNEFEGKFDPDVVTFENPAKPGHIEGYEWKDYLKLALKMMLECEAVVLIDGWQSSKGCLLELHVAKSLGMRILKIVDENAWIVTVEDITSDDYDVEDVLIEANSLVYGNRQASYSHPMDDYTRTSALWNTILADKLKESLTAEDAIMCMIMVKASRQVHKHKRDNLVDMAGYAQCMQRVVMRRKEEE